MALTTNLVNYWKLDESSGDAADSVASNTLMNRGTVTYVSGKINNGASTVDHTSRFRMTSQPTTGSSDISVSMWLNWAGVGSYALTWGVNSNTQGVIFGTSGHYTSASAYGAASSSTGTVAIDDGNWHHIVYVYDHTTGFKTYVDGSTDGGTYAYTSLSVNSGGIGYVSGAFWNGLSPDPGGDNGLTAIFDEIGVWSRVLNSTEVSQLYNSGNGLQYPFTLVSFSVNETESVTENVSITQIYLISTSDTETSTESVNTTKVFTTSVFDIENTSENVSIIENIIINVGDTESTTENIQISMTPMISVTDTESVAESVSVLVFFASFITISDTESIAENISTSVQSFISVTDTETATENIKIEKNSYINVSDTESITENILSKIVSVTFVYDSSSPSEFVMVTANEQDMIYDIVTTTEWTMTNIIDAISISDTQTTSENVSTDSIRYEPQIFIPVGRMKSAP